MKTVNGSAMAAAEAREALEERMKTSVGRPFLADLECERLMEAADAYALAVLSELAQALGEETYLEPRIWDAFERVRREIKAPKGGSNAG